MKPSNLIEKKCLMILLLFHLFRFAYLQTVFFEQFNPKSRRIIVIFNSVVTADLKKFFVNVMSYFQSSIRKLILSFQIRRSLSIWEQINWHYKLPKSDWTLKKQYLGVSPISKKFKFFCYKIVFLITNKHERNNSIKNRWVTKGTRDSFFGKQRRIWMNKKLKFWLFIHFYFLIIIVMNH
jgi:hypothetical protein